MNQKERYQTDAEYRGRMQNYQRERYRKSERCRERAREYIKEPEVAQRRAEYMAAYRGTTLSEKTKYYNKEKEEWSTPAQGPIRFYHPSSVGPNAGKTLVYEPEYSEYHSPEIETIRFVGL